MTVQELKDYLDDYRPDTPVYVAETSEGRQFHELQPTDLITNVTLVEVSHFGNVDKPTGICLWPKTPVLLITEDVYVDTEQ